ncbi:MAG TPA: proton-conducting transporter membrane subunit [Longimicrobiales bacterium]|nr:proton-conducting transporter membrane subunit [Longimicrobiales bacterium]
MSLAPGSAAGMLLVIAAVAWPASLALAWLVPVARRWLGPLVQTMALPALVLAFTADAGMELRVVGLYTSLTLGVDPVGRPFLLLKSLLWTVAAVHAATYMREDPRRSTFTGFLLATGTGNIGLVLAHDALGFYLFFALMTFAAYGLVVHTRTAEALRAGRVYIGMAILGEALLLAGLLAAAGLAGDVSFRTLPAAFADFPRPDVVAGLLLFGLGVKAGLVPLHVWLPLAHPVAPTPASALLSGAMIKAGVLGWLRFLPMGELALPGLGAAVMGLGVLAMFYAAVLGVLQSDAKTVLAYSSVSQMGFLATGVGAALVVPDAAPLLVLAVAVYALHHALAKGALFLAIGVVPARALRGRISPWLAVAAIPALALAGAPLTSGAIAKLALKNALGELPAPWPARVDVLLGAAAVATTLLMARYLATLRARAGTDDATEPYRPGLIGPWAGLVLVSAAAAAWLPAALAPLGELPLATQPRYIAAAAWPLVLGVALATGTILLGRRVATGRLGEAPAGDLIVVAEAAVAAARRAGPPLRALREQVPQTRIARWLARVAADPVDRTARALEAATTGPALGAVLCVLAGLLFMALR